MRRFHLRAATIRTEQALCTHSIRADRNVIACIPNIFVNLEIQSYATFFICTAPTICASVVRMAAAREAAGMPPASGVRCKLCRDCELSAAVGLRHTFFCTGQLFSTATAMQPKSVDFIPHSNNVDTIAPRSAVAGMSLFFVFFVFLVQRFVVIFCMRSAEFHFLAGT